MSITSKHMEAMLMDPVVRLYLERFGVLPKDDTHRVDFHGVYQTTTARSAGRCTNLVIACSDWTLGEPQREFIKDCCGISSASSITIPGGPLAFVCGFPDLIHRATHDGRSRQVVVNAFLSMPRLLYQKLGSSKVWAITHSGCGFCGELFEELADDTEAMRRFQGMLMAEFGRLIGRAIPGAAVRLFHADGSHDERQQYSEILPAPALAVS